MLAVPCGLPSYVGSWPPVRAGAAMIEPLAKLASSTPHSSSACGGGALYGARPGRAPTSAAAASQRRRRELHAETPVA